MSLIFDQREFADHCRRSILQKKDSIRGETNEFHSLSIAESVEIVVERGSGKDRYFLRETEM